MSTCGKRAPGVLRSLNGICSKAGHSKIISGARRTVIATFLAMHKFHGPRRTCWLRDLAGLQNAPGDAGGLAAHDVNMRVKDVLCLFMKLFELADNAIQPPDGDLSCHGIISVDF
jgi:hypothetical protein